MKSPEQVKAAITAKLATKALPFETSQLISTSLGTGEDVCAACDEPIRATDVDCGCDFSDRTLHFHLDCFTEWRRQQRG